MHMHSETAPIVHGVLLSFMALGVPIMLGPVTEPPGVLLASSPPLQAVPTDNSSSAPAIDGRFQMRALTGAEASNFAKSTMSCLLECHPPTTRSSPCGA